MIRCLHCDAETNNGLALCELCQRKAQTCFEFLPIYFRNLARWRPGRAGSRPVPGSRVLYDGHDRSQGTGDRISDRLDETANMLITWADVLADHRPYLRRLLDRLADAREAERVDEAQEVAWLCAGFSKYLASVATLEWAGEFVRELSRFESVLRSLTEAAIPGWYAGECRQRVTMEETCGADTYVVPGLTWVTCGRCGTTTYARDHLAVVLDEARTWVARPKRIAEAIVALVDTEASVPRLYTRIRQWAHQGDLEPIYRTRRGYAWCEDAKRFIVATEETGYARYRMGEALDLALRNTPRVGSSVAS